MPIDLRIVTGASSPIYRQICDQIGQGVANGLLQAGEQLPSVRALAQSLLINPNTVARAYGDLMRDGMVEGQPGRGIFVAQRRPVYTRAERLRRIEPSLTALANDAVMLDFGATEIHDLLDKKLRQIGLADAASDRNKSSGSTGGKP
jgi:GntR family transcriptional regulator